MHCKKLLPTLAATQCNQSRQSHSAILLLPGPPVPHKTRIKVAANFQSRKLFAASHAKQRLGGVGSDGKLSCFMASRREWSWMAWSSGVCQRPPHQPKPSKGRQLSVGWRPKRISRLATRRILAGGVKEPKETFLANAFIALSRLNVSPLRNGSLLAWGGWHVSTGPLPAEELY